MEDYTLCEAGSCWLIDFHVELGGTTEASRTVFGNPENDVAEGWQRGTFFMYDVSAGHDGNRSDEAYTPPRSKKTISISNDTTNIPSFATCFAHRCRFLVANTVLTSLKKSRRSQRLLGTASTLTLPRGGVGVTAPSTEAELALESRGGWSRRSSSERCAWRRFFRKFVGKENPLILILVKTYSLLLLLEDSHIDQNVASNQGCLHLLRRPLREMNRIRVLGLATPLDASPQTSNLRLRLPLLTARPLPNACIVSAASPSSSSSSSASHAACVAASSAAFRITEFVCILLLDVGLARGFGPCLDKHRSFNNRFRYGLCFNFFRNITICKLTVFVTIPQGAINPFNTVLSPSVLFRNPSNRPRCKDLVFN